METPCHLENLLTSDVNIAVRLNARQVLTDENTIRSEEDQNSMHSNRDGVVAVESPSKKATYDWPPISLDAEQVFGDMDKILLLIAKEN